MKKTALLVTLSVALCAIVTASSASADPYHRFWRGKKLDSINEQDFQKGLNDTFISRTIQSGAGKGLIAYQPVLVEGTPAQSQGALPDEIALVSYRDEASYNAIRATPEGQDYSAFHWNYFDKSKSSSLVPEPYSGTLAFEHAYDLHPAFSDWMTAATRFQIQFRNPGETVATYLQRIKAELDHAQSADDSSAISGRVCLVAENYWIEYVAKKRLTKQVSLNPIVTNFRDFGADKAITFPIERKAVDSAKLKPGNGVNVQF